MSHDCREITRPEKASLFVVRQGAGQRLDQYLARIMEGQAFSRARIQSLIKAGQVMVNGAAQKPKYVVQAGDQVAVTIPETTPSALVPEDVSFVNLFEDDYIVVLAKPPGVVVHPACGNHTATLVHGLLYHCRNLSGISGELRPGIVHRLDRDTSGVMVVAKNDLAHRNLQQQFKNREVEKIYQAIVLGTVSPPAGRIDLPIGRHAVNRKKMAVRDDGRAAATNWRVVENFFKTGFGYLELRLETGRTHQIRVHLAALGHPVAGDRVYGGVNRASREHQIGRQYLHASSLAFRHPATGEGLKVTAPLWQDMRSTLARLRQEEGM